MGGLFSKPDSARRQAREAERAAKKAEEEERERLRLQEQKLRRRESSETIQGEGIATTGNITFGTDLGEQATGREEANVGAYVDPDAEVAAPELTREQEIQALRDRIKNSEFNFNGSSLR